MRAQAVDSAREGALEFIKCVVPMQFERSFTGRIHCLSAHVVEPYTSIPFRAGHCLLFGAETRGLPPEVLERYRGQCYTIPMVSEKVRSLNLATAAGIVLYQGLRQ